MNSLINIDQELKNKANEVIANNNKIDHSLDRQREIRSQLKLLKEMNIAQGELVQNLIRELSNDDE